MLRVYGKLDGHSFATLRCPEVAPHCQLSKLHLRHPEEAAVQAAASAGEWAYRRLTLGRKQPDLRRDSIHHLDRSVCWWIERAKDRLGYEPVVDQDEATKRTMDWAVSPL
ncbi:hypothetical protein DPSP01_013812 [Paraphaeosphaeria sporulosa]